MLRNSDETLQDALCGSTATSFAQKDAVMWATSMPCIVSAHQTKGPTLATATTTLAVSSRSYRLRPWPMRCRHELVGGCRKAKAEELATPRQRMIVSRHTEWWCSAKDSTVHQFPVPNALSHGERESLTVTKRKIGFRSCTLRASTWSSRVHRLKSCGRPCVARRASGAEGPQWLESGERAPVSVGGASGNASNS